MNEWLSEWVSEDRNFYLPHHSLLTIVIITEFCLFLQQKHHKQMHILRCTVASVWSNGNSSAKRRRLERKKLLFQCKIIGFDELIFQIENNSNFQWVKIVRCWSTSTSLDWVYHRWCSNMNSSPHIYSTFVEWKKNSHKKCIRKNTILTRFLRPKMFFPTAP